jgi:hypothetical protein
MSMSDPHNTDPRLVDPPVPPNPNRHQAEEMKDANRLWGWIAGGTVLLLLLALIFGNAMNPSSTAGLGDQNTPSQTGSTQPSPPATPPATTGGR